MIDEMRSAESSSRAEATNAAGDAVLRQAVATTLVAGSRNARRASSTFDGGFGGSVASAGAEELDFVGGPEIIASMSISGCSGCCCDEERNWL
jgi:hypothetical protein